MTKVKVLSVSILLPVIFALTYGCAQTDQDINQNKSETVSSEPEVETVLVATKSLKRTMRIPAELTAFRDVAIYPKIQGFVKSMQVDRGSIVKKGQLLVEIDAPELEANLKEAQAKYESACSSLLESESKIQSVIAQKDEDIAKLEADEANYKRILHAAQTAGAIAPADIEEAQKTMQGSKAHVRSSEQNILGAKSESQAHKGKVKAAEQALNSLREMTGYLKIRAPFEGVIRERNVHEGSLVSSSSNNVPMLKIAETSKLRLMVPVPESAVSGIKQGSQMNFSVPAYVGKLFSGKVSRLSHELDRKTRTMMVELDVDNRKADLEPGMYAEVVWIMERPYKTLFVPSGAVLSAEDKTSVIKVKDMKTQIISVTRGQPMNNLVEVTGDIKEGDEIVLHATEDYKSGTKLKSHLLSIKDIEAISGDHED
jgi:RND family efflux transporter MFP subunit